MIMVQRLSRSPTPRAATLAVSVLIVWSGCVLRSRPARAADTNEQFDPGFSNAELYCGYEGLGLERAEQAVLGEGVLGYGILPELSGN